MSVAEIYTSRRRIVLVFRVSRSIADAWISSRVSTVPTSPGSKGNVSVQCPSVISWSLYIRLSTNNVA